MATDFTDRISGYVSGYEFRGDGGDHAPTEAEQALLEDALNGFVADIIEPAVSPLLGSLALIRSGYPKNSNAYRIADAALAKARGEQVSA